MGSNMYPEYIVAVPLLLHTSPMLNIGSQVEAEYCIIYSAHNWTRRTIRKVKPKFFLTITKLKELRN